MRTLLRAIATLLILSFAASAGTAAARNVILMIGDGMGPSHIRAAQLYSSRAQNRELHMIEVMQQGHTAYLVNDTTDALVTESAAAATQIACGVKVPARAVGMGTDGKTPCRTILELAREHGMATGLVTNSGLTDATPAAFSAHVEDRGDEPAVAKQQIGTGIEMLLGGRRRYFLPPSTGGVRKDGRDLLQEARANRYQVVQTAAELKRSAGAKVLGLFSMGNMALEIDRANTEEPSLAEMTTVALRALSENPRGFFAMIEGGRIDHAAHANDATATVRDVVAFDEAVGVALEFLRRNADTLLIVTADHETGGMALIGDGSGGGIDFAAMAKTRVSIETFPRELVGDLAPARLRAAAREQLGLELRDEDASQIAREIRRSDISRGYIRTPRSLISLLQRHLGVGWATQGHTASPVFAFGMGPGSEHLVGYRHNTDLFRIMREALESQR
ncbi:MAG: alkaline phosphatase [Pseudomonadota bacterium]